MKVLVSGMLLLLLLSTFLYSQDKGMIDIHHFDTQIGFATGYLGIALLSAHGAAPDTYNLRVHSISHLGSQGYEKAWIMNAGFIGFGGMVAGSTIAYSIRTGQDWPLSLGLGTWGLGILASGFASLSPFVEGVPYNPTESQWHSLFATTAGIGISAAALNLVITDPEPERKLVHGTALTFISLTSAMTGLQPENTGLWQRLLWAGSLGWLNWAFATDPRYSR